jgi:hypothetical protein
MSNDRESRLVRALTPQEKKLIYPLAERAAVARQQLFAAVTELRIAIDATGGEGYEVDLNKGTFIALAGGEIVPHPGAET